MLLISNLKNQYQGIIESEWIISYFIILPMKYI